VNVAIISDSTCCLPVELIKKYDIHIVPLIINYHDKSFHDGVDISATEVYQIMRRKEDLPTTSTPPPTDFMNIFRDIGNKNKNMVCITVTGLQSKVYETAVIAKNMLKEESPALNIEVFDSRAVSGAMGFIVLAAARKAAEGADIDEVIMAASDMQSRVNFLAMLDTLYYLARTGRIARAAAWATSILDVKPVVEHDPAIGETTPFARPRTRQKAVDTMLKEMKKRVGNKKVHVMVHHADELEACLELRNTIQNNFDCNELYMTEFTPIMGVHAGAGVLAISFYTE
jgi:DegV family protein with EDD domain